MTTKWIQKILIMALAITSSPTWSKANPLPTVSNVNLDRYLGLWYEVARKENKFQKNCKDSKAHYSLLPGGDIQVINSCHLNSSDGPSKVARGRGWAVDDVNFSKLKVQFFLSSVRIPRLAGDYWIIDLDDDYRYSMVSEPQKKYLWILSRTPTLDKEILNHLIAKAKSLGIDVSNLIIN